MDAGSVFEIYANKKPTATVKKVEEGVISIPKLKEYSKVKIFDFGNSILIQPVTP